jgi:hypothetical protein
VDRHRISAHDRIEVNKVRLHHLAFWSSVFVWADWIGQRKETGLLVFRVFGFLRKKQPKEMANVCAILFGDFAFGV